MSVEERICETVRGYIHLYDSTVPGHRDKQRCKNSWEEIGGALGLSAKEAHNATHYRPLADFSQQP